MSFKNVGHRVMQKLLKAITKPAQVDFRGIKNWSGHINARLMRTFKSRLNVLIR
jgi:hypothetical protein